MAKVITAKEAAALIPDGAVFIGATFGCSGVCEDTFNAIQERFLETGHPQNLTYTHAAGSGDFGPGRSRGEDALAHEGLLTKWVGSHIGCSNVTTKMIMENKLAAWNLPLGTLLQIYKEQARGLNFCISKCGLGTFVDPRFDGAKVTPMAEALDEELVEYLPDFNGEEYLLYKGLPLTHAFIKGTYADTDGNISIEKEPYNLEMLTVAQACRANGGIVIAEVEQILQPGTMNPKNIKVPGIYVDYLIKIKDVNNLRSTVGGPYNPAFTGECKIAMENSVPPLPFDGVKAAIRRTAMEIKKGSKCNFGLGMPQMVGSVLNEEGVDDYITMISESGAIGGVPGVGVNFGAHYNVASLTDQGDHFNFFDGGGLEFGAFGLSEVDPTGGINTSLLNGILKGIGGFMNIAATAKNAVFVGTFTAGGIKTSVKDGKLVIDQEGRFKKFVKKCPQLSFSCQESVKAGQHLLYITERCVFQGTEEGLLLIEIAPGIDLQKDILDQMEFMPIIPEGGPKLMDAGLFQEKWGGLKAYLDAKE